MCVKCQQPITQNYYLMGERVFRCKVCHTRISPFADTALRGMRISVSNLFWLIYALADLTRSTSSTRLAKDTGIDVKNVHRLSMIIRKLLLRPFLAKMSGSIEIDEAFLGKGSKVWNWGAISTTKQPIIGMICRETKEARVFLVGNRRASTLNALIRNNVLAGATIYTDGWRGYTDLAKDYTHIVVDHSKREYVRGDAHTNTIENLWGRIKRNLRGEHIKVTAKYVECYLNEACFRHNSKGKKRMEVFDEILKLTFSSGFDWSTLGILKEGGSLRIASKE